MTCFDWTKLSLEERWQRFRPLAATLFPGNSADQRAQIAAVLGGIAVRETKLLVQIAAHAAPSPLFSGFKCPPRHRPPVLIDDYTDSAALAQGCVNPNLANRKWFKYALEIGALKPAKCGYVRGELMPVGLSNLVFEWALVHGDLSGLHAFSVTTWGHFLGAGFRLKGAPTKRVNGLPPEYDDLASLKAWYIAASVNELDACRPLLWTEGGAFKNYPSGTVYDDQTMVTYLKNSHTGGSYAADAYWKEMRGYTTSHYESWRK